jgi:hypothetical protein
MPDKVDYSKWVISRRSNFFFRTEIYLIRTQGVNHLQTDHLNTNHGDLVQLTPATIWTELHFIASRSSRGMPTLRGSTVVVRLWIHQTPPPQYALTPDHKSEVITQRSVFCALTISTVGECNQFSLKSQRHTGSRQKLDP